MAALRPKHKPLENVFWTENGVSGQESTVPGVSDLGNIRPCVKKVRSKEIKTIVPVHQPAVENLDPMSSKSTCALTSEISCTLASTDMSTTATSTLSRKKVSLRDLCPEDKKRVANLIKELAKVGEEKENTEKNLEKERNHYEEQILKLVEQQEQILKEREEVQSKLFEYHTCILKLQQQQQLQNLQQQQTNLQQNALSLHKNATVGGRSKTAKQVSQRGQADISRHPIQQTVRPDVKEEKEKECDLDFEEENSRNLYMNDLEDTGKENFFTQAQPSLSPPQVMNNIMPHRSFTAMIDQELSNQRKILKANIVQVNNENGDNQLPTGYGDITSGRKAGELTLLAKTRQQGEANVVKKSSQMWQVLALTNISQQEKQNLGYGQDKLNFVGNSQFLSPEKNELITRFIESQAITAEFPASEHRRHQILSQGEQRQQCQELVRLPEQSNVTKQGKHKGKKRKERKPPPPSYGPLQAPVMSSTQKSSEFADVISIDSTGLSDLQLPFRHTIKNQPIPYDIDIDVDNNDKANNKHLDISHFSNSNNNNDNGDENFNKKKASSEKKSKSGKEKEEGAKVEFSELPAQREKGLYGTKEAKSDMLFIDRYKKMSASERRTELLRQRTMLLDEQNRLKQILADQEYQLKIKQQEALKQVNEMKTADNTQKGEVKKIQESLQRMEEDLARKEKELVEGRQLLAKRFQEFESVKESTRNSLSKMETQQVKGDHFKSSQPSPHSSKGFLVEERNKKEPEKLPTANDIPIEGKDGDEHVVYSASKERQVVKTLDFSMYSDTESETGGQLVSQGTLAGATSDYKEGTKPHDVNSGKEIGPSKVDVGTSISFGHLSSDGTDLPKLTDASYRKSSVKPRAKPFGSRTGFKDKNISAHRNSGLSRRKSNPYAVSPGEKTLSVLEIINSMSDTDTVSTSRHQTTGQQPLSTSFSNERVGYVQHRNTVTTRHNPPVKSYQDRNESDDILDLFKVKRKIAKKSNSWRSQGSGRDHLDVSYAWEENVDDVVKLLSNNSKDKNAYCSDVDDLKVDDYLFNDEEDKSFNDLMKKMHKLSVVNDDLEDVLDSQDTDSLLELQESQILEDVFFMA